MTKKKPNVLITGASSGIGEALARHYAITGAGTLFISGRNRERLETVKTACERYNVKVYAEVMDVTDRQNTAAWIKKCEEIAPLNIVYANAGVATLEETPENIYNTFNTNVIGVLNTLIPAVEIFKNRRDKHKTLVITSSIAGYHGLPPVRPTAPPKPVSKPTAKALRSELRQFSIQVSVICPGFVNPHYRSKYLPNAFFHVGRKSGQNHCRKSGRKRRTDSFSLADAFCSLVHVDTAQLCQRFRLCPFAAQGLTMAYDTAAICFIILEIIAVSVLFYLRNK